jgi:hypothetical protein
MGKGAAKRQGRVKIQNRKNLKDEKRLIVGTAGE